MTYASVVLDVDSTLCGVEGIDWLAQQRGDDVARRTRELTDRAMSGDIPLDAVYGERLELIRPSRADVDALARVYRATLADGAAGVIAALRVARVRVILVSGGIRQAIAPLAAALHVELYAVDLRWNLRGEYTGFDQESPLTTQAGKCHLVRALELPPPSLAVGDGATDLAMKPELDLFVAYTGFVRREGVVRQADGEIGSFAELAALALPAAGP